MGIMRLMDATGDKTTATWDPADEAQVTTATQLFNAYRAKGITMFKDQDAAPTIPTDCRKATGSSHSSCICAPTTAASSASLVMRRSPTSSSALRSRHRRCASSASSRAHGPSAPRRHA